MKVRRGISLLLIYSVLALTLGFWGGIKAAVFFYPGSGQAKQQGEDAGERRADAEPDAARDGEKEIAEVSQRNETLSAETEYVLAETDILRETVVETVRRLPGKYVGMNREQFMDAMKIFESAPPLSELERGFVSLNVLAFSRERVVVQMNYRYLQPGECYYLAVRDHEVVVYLEDKKTVYINTGIRMETLPWEVQEDVMRMMYIEDEEKLYNFLETYSS